MGSLRKYSESKLNIMEKDANKAVRNMTLVGVGFGFVPVFLDVSGLMVAMGVGVVSVAAAYGIEINKKNAGELIKQFFKAAGMTFSFVLVGGKITASLLKSNPVTYLPTMIADGVTCGMTAYAVGSTSQKYFHKMAKGEKVTRDEIKKWMHEGKNEGKKIAKSDAQQKAKEYKS